MIQDIVRNVLISDITIFRHFDIIVKYSGSCVTILYKGIGVDSEYQTYKEISYRVNLR